ncbi:hypothetical protein PIB30_024680 [Stylosanthes scabra]|uniref:Uncharacterized protein n=1 Tax=Stylosanthes scabra TaxID=79078 RepID=A0ABU6Z9I1_9FABA|nr:hypothetical protein [Stylosanthes scabra]
MKVAKKSKRNEEIMKKSLEANFAADAYASMVMCATDEMNGVSSDAVNTTFDRGLVRAFVKFSFKRCHRGTTKFGNIEYWTQVVLPRK